MFDTEAVTASIETESSGSRLINGLQRASVPMRDDDLPLSTLYTRGLNTRGTETNAD
jgi:hypothetical protein